MPVIKPTQTSSQCLIKNEIEHLRAENATLRHFQDKLIVAFEIGAYADMRNIFFRLDRALSKSESKK